MTKARRRRKKIHTFLIYRTVNPRRGGILIFRTGGCCKIYGVRFTPVGGVEISLTPLLAKLHSCCFNCFLSKMLLPAIYHLKVNGWHRFEPLPISHVPIGL